MSASSRAAERMLAECRKLLAEQIARAIKATVCEPGAHCADNFCADCIRFEQATADAAIALRIGGVPE